MVASFKEFADCLQWASGQFVLQFPSGLPEAGHYGSLVHGVLGMNLRRLRGCGDEKCGDCSNNSRCAYSKLYEPRPKDGHPLGLVGKVPPPWSLSAYLAGNCMELKINLLGDAGTFKNEVHRALLDSAPGGLGRERRQFELMEAKWQQYSSAEYSWENGRSNLEVSGIISLEFVSPLRIIKDKQIMRQFDAQVLARDLCMRIANWGFNYQNLPWPPPWMEVLEEARQIRVIQSQLEIATLERYSARQRQRLHLEGMSGAVELSGVGRTFLRLLDLGMATHAGKGATIGLGEYRISLKRRLPAACL